MGIVQPVDGRFVHSEEARARACADDGHRKDYLNLSVSAKVGKNVYQCHCGLEDEAPAALKKLRAAKRKAKRKAKVAEVSA